MNTEGSANRISIGLPVYNGARYLREAIEAHLAQTHPEFELLISDNASTDATEEISREYERLDSRVRYHRLPVNVGMTANHVHTLTNSSGRYYRWAHADDVPDPGLLEESLARLQSDERVVLCVPNTRSIDQHGNVTRLVPRSLELGCIDAVGRAKSILTGDFQMVFFQGLIKRDVLMATSRRWRYFGWDFILLLELALSGGVVQTEHAWLSRRAHSNQATNLQHESEVALRTVEPSLPIRFIFPHWRLQSERCRAILNSSLLLDEKLRLLAFMSRHSWWSRGLLVKDLRFALDNLKNGPRRLSL